MEVFSVCETKCFSVNHRDGREVRCSQVSALNFVGGPLWDSVPSTNNTLLSPFLYTGPLQVEAEPIRNLDGLSQLETWSGRAQKEPGWDEPIRNLEGPR